MARQESQSKALYYPTPIAPVVDLIATWFKKSDVFVRLADPCVGEGIALRRLADLINAPKKETWGVEVSYSRAEKAEKVIDTVLPVSLNIAHWDPRSVSLLFNNPPYDWSDSVDSNNKRLRQEEVFLTKGTDKLMVGGVHVYIVPQWILAREGVARHWLGWYDRWAAFRFPDPEFEAFGQIVLMGQRRAQYHVANKMQGEAFVALGAEGYELEVLRPNATGEGYYTLPKAPGFAKFTYTPFDNDLVAKAIVKTNHLNTRDWDRVSYVRPLGAPIRPIVQLKIGHLSMLISGGELGIVSMDTDDGRGLVKGTLRKVIDRHSEDIINEDGKVSGQKIEEQERLQSIISVLNAGGKLEMLNGTQNVADFITKYAAPLADAVLAHNEPFYDWKPTQQEWKHAGKAAMGLPPLPGRQERGLFDVQKHFAIAAARFQKQGNKWMGGRGWKHVVFNCEMGFGKGGLDSTNILTPTGWTTFGKIKVGDRVIGSDGKPHNVTGVFPRGHLDVFRVTFNDGSSVVCDDDHLWEVNTPNRRYKGKPANVLALREIRKRLTDTNGNRLHFIPMVQPVQFEQQGQLPIDPYLLGYILGNGCSRRSCLSITIPEQEMLDRITSLLPEGDSLKQRGKYDWRINGAGTLHAWDALGLTGHKAQDKYVPKQYLFASIENRLALLRGLMDSDGYCSQDGANVEFTTASIQLAADVEFLVQSFGGVARRSIKEEPHYTHNGEDRIGLPSYRVGICMPDGFNPFLLTRKAELCPDRPKYKPARAISSVEPCGRENVTCIAVDAPDQLYVTDDFIVTHNTSTAVATMEQLNKWPGLVMCPGHMVFKWMTQIVQASDVDSPIQARVITRPVREGASWLYTDVMPILANYQASLADDKRWQVEPVGDRDSGGRRKLTVKVESKPGVIMVKGKDGEESAQQVSNLRLHLISALTMRLSVRQDTVPVVKQMTADGFTIEFMDRDEYTMADFYADATFGRLGMKPVAVVSFEPAKYGAGMRDLSLKWRYFTMYSSVQERLAKVQAPVCPGCGKPLGVSLDPEILLNFKAPIWYTDNELEDDNKGNFKLVFDEKLPEICPHYDEHGIKGDDGQPVMQNGLPLMVRRPCNTRLYEMSRWRREGLSRLIQRKYPHWFKCYIADEVHESKSADTDIGTADGRFISSIEHSLALTGTLFGGTASSLFYLFFRRNPEVRRNYQYKEGRTVWVDHFGLWRYRWVEKPNDDRYVQRGRSSGVKRWDTKPPQEMPGISPAVVRYLLPITLFGKITDLGYTLPPLYDHVETVEMAPEQGKQYREMDKDLLNMALDRIRTDHDSSMLTTWFTNTRYRPMSAFRHEWAVWKENPILELGPVVVDGGLLPKEQRMAEIIKENASQGRKTLVFVEQTGTRDIRERLVRTVNDFAPMVNIQTLSAGEVKPAKREMWIRRNAPTMDAMLVNAGLVKTGLDLVMFSDIIFYEINSSLYTVWQAMRRVWRLGQKNTVRTTFLAYNATMEARLLERMGKKMKAAMLLYGDNAAGALIESDGEDDIAREVIRAALAGKTIENAGEINGKSLFGSGEEHAVLVSNSPMGSVLAASPQMVILVPSEPEPLPELFNLDEVSQMGLFGDMLYVPVTAKKRRR